MSRIGGTIVALAAIFCLGGGEVRADPKCLDFADLQHCAVGAALLQPSSDSLTVHNPSGGSGGVAIEVPDVRSWRAENAIEFPRGANGVLVADSLADGAVTSQAQVKLSDQGLRLTAAFTGSESERSYRVAVFLDGVLQATAAGVPSGLNGSTGTSVSEPEVLASRSYDYNSEFFIAPNGACQWTFSFEGQQPSEQARGAAAGGSAYSITLPNGVTVQGDEIRMTEEVTPAGAYPYTSFDGLVFRGNFVALTFKSEVVD